MFRTWGSETSLETAHINGVYSYEFCFFYLVTTLRWEEGIHMGSVCETVEFQFRSGKHYPCILSQR